MRFNVVEVGVRRRGVGRQSVFAEDAEDERFDAVGVGVGRARMEISGRSPAGVVSPPLTIRAASIWRHVVGGARGERHDRQRRFFSEARR